ncbi:MAG: TonB-dependent receptor [Balneolaceae bacterium]
MNFIQSKKLLLFFYSVLAATPLIAQTTDTEKDSTDIYDEIIMERITVTGTPAWISQIPGSASYIGSEQLKKHSYTDVNRVLRNVSGVYIQEEDGFGLRPNIGLRGAGAERSSKINLMEDGVLIAPAPYSAPAAYYFPNISRMSSMEVRKGSSQIKYGPNTTGGAINMISTRIPYEFTVNSELSIGQNSAHKLHANVGNSYKNLGYLLEGLQLTNDGFKELDGGGSTGYDIMDLMGKIMFRTNTDADVYQRVDFKLGYYDEISDETYLGLSRDDFEATPFRRYAASQSDRMNAEHFQFTARHFAQFSPNADLTTTAYHNKFKRDWYKLQSVNGIGPAGALNDPGSNQSVYDILRGADSEDDALSIRSNNREYYSQGIESIFALTFNAGTVSNQVELGIRLHQDEEDRYQYEDAYKMENGSLILTTPGTPGTQANRVGSAKAVSVFLQDKILYEKFTFTPGIRYENIRFENRNYGSDDLQRTGSALSLNKYSIDVFVPGMGITYRAADNFTLITGLHKGFSPPSPGSSSETRSEKSINYELGFRFDNNLIQAEIIGFYNDFNNLLGSDLAASGGSGTTAQFNAGEVEVIGLEIAANTDLAQWLNASLTIPLNINYTFTEATFKTDFESSFGPWATVQEGDKIPFIPTHQFNAALGVEAGQFSINLNAMSSAPMRTRAGAGSIPQEYSTDGYFLIDANTSYNVSNSVSMFMNLRNAFDKTYIVSDKPHGLRPGLPRTFLGGMKISL